MDVVCHAVAGAATGMIWGRPILGAVIAAAPDAVLGLRRRLIPGPAYNFTHSLAFIGVAAAVAMLAGGAHTAALVTACLLSHLALDLPTHGPNWAPPLLYPFNKKRFFYAQGGEWEFFNEHWKVGFAVTITWSFLCLQIWLLSAIGFRLLRFVL